MGDSGVESQLGPSSLMSIISIPSEMRQQSLGEATQTFRVFQLVSGRTRLGTQGM